MSIGGGSSSEDRGMEKFDPALHRVAEPRRFADLRVGERFALPSRTVTAAEFAAFRALSGDNHPIHYDAEYCRARGYPDLLAHGLLVLCFTAAGAGSFPHAIGDALLGFVEQSSKFLKPVFVGDTLYPVLAIAALVPQRTTSVVVMAASVRNQRRELVRAGEHKYLLRKE
jgi:acyl dehydratase